MRPLFRSTCILLPLLAALAAGCRDSSVASYRIPKERDEPARPQTAVDGFEPRPGMAGAASEAGALTWTAPAQWRSKPASAMRKGSYTVGQEGGPTADLSITAFPGDVGGEIANVNRWRGQVGLTELPEAEVPALITRLSAGALPIGYVDLVNGGQRMLAAFVPYQGATWFFKLTGPTSVVAAEKDAYVGLLGSIRPVEGGAPAAGASGPAPAGHPPVGDPATTATAAPGAAMTDTAVTTAEGPELKWSAPAHWESRSGSSMRKGSYTVKGAGDSVADLSITAFPGDVGGELANVNRWRGQLQLAPLAADQLDASVVRRVEGSLHVTIVDFAGGDAAQPMRMLGAIVPFNGATWFFKLVGPDELVAREKTVFLDFLHTLQAP